MALSVNADANRPLVYVLYLVWQLKWEAVSQLWKSGEERKQRWSLWRQKSSAFSWILMTKPKGGVLGETCQQPFLLYEFGSSLQSESSFSYKRHRWLWWVLRMFHRDILPAKLLCPGNPPGKNTGVGSHCLLRGIFPTQGSNPSLPHCRWFFTFWASRDILLMPEGLANNFPTLRRQRWAFKIL